MNWHFVLEQIIDSIRACMCGWRDVDRSSANQKLLEAWRVPFDVFKSTVNL